MMNIKTSDIFNIADKKLAHKHSRYCLKKACDCGLKCTILVKDGVIRELFISGPKSKVAKYYFATLKSNRNLFVGVKRLFKVITTF